MMWYGNWTALDWLLMSVGMLVFWALVVVAIVWIVRSIERPRQDSSRENRVSLDKTAQPTRPSAREVLDERYARGEIDDEEYRTRRDNLVSR